MLDSRYQVFLGKLLRRVQVRTRQPKWKVQDSRWVSFYLTEKTGYTLERNVYYCDCRLLVRDYFDLLLCPWAYSGLVYSYTGHMKFFYTSTLDGESADIGALASGAYLEPNTYGRS